MRKFIILFISLISFFGCKKEQESNVPSVPVNITLNLDDPTYSNLNSIGGTVTIEGGLKGIIVYRKSAEEYAAYERSCPYTEHGSCEGIVNIIGSSIEIQDSCCGSKFLLMDGSPSGGPNNQPLRSYSAEEVNRYLYIRN